MTVNCKNCHQIVSGNYCANCGQKASVGRLKLRDVAHDLLHSITHADSGILKLTKDLLIRPGHTYVAYFNGERKKYYSPVLYFFIAFAIYTFLDQYVFDYQDYLFKTNNEFGRAEHAYSKYFALQLLPLQVIITWLFYFRRRNLAECIVFWLYVIGFTQIILSILTVFKFAFIGHLRMIGYGFNIIEAIILIWHGWSVFGKTIVQKILFVLIIYLNYLLLVYLQYYFFRTSGLDFDYPSLWRASKEIFSLS